jgi:hypothetical protein
MPKSVLGHYLSRLPCSAVWIWPAGCVGSPAQEKCERKSRFGSEGVTLELPCGLPWSEDRAYSIPLVCRRQPRMLPSPWTSSSPAQERFCPRGGLPWSYPVAYPVPTLGYRVAETKWAAARSTGRGRRRAQHQQEARGEARRTVSAPSPCVARFSSYRGRCPGALQGKPTETARAENG